MQRLLLSFANLKTHSFNSWWKMASRLSLEQRKKIAVWMEVFPILSVVRSRCAEYFSCDPQSRLTIYRVYEKLVYCDSVQDNHKVNSGRPRLGRSIENVLAVENAFAHNPWTWTRQYSAETGLRPATVWRILTPHIDSGMRPSFTDSWNALFRWQNHTC